MEKSTKKQKTLASMISYFQETEPNNEPEVRKTSRNDERKMYLIKRMISENYELPEKIKWKKWSMKEDKYRMSCHLKNLKKTLQKRTNLQYQSIDRIKMNKAKHELRRLNNLNF